MTLCEIVKKRKDRWQERHDGEYDTLLTTAAAREILSNKELRNEIQLKPYLLIEATFTIVDKKKRTVPFFLNEVQQDFIEKFERFGTSKPFFILKGRQQGFTTLITAMQLAYAIVQKNFSGFTLADRGDNTLSIFNDKARMVYSRLPDILRPKEKYNSAKELFFEKLNSSWRVATASDNVGRSRTLSFVHFSEVAFYDCSLSDLQAGIGEAMTENAVRIYESTANGFGESKDLWDSGACVNLFYEWWRSDEYRCSEYEYLETNDEWLSERIKLLENKGLDREQIAWYCRKYSSYLDKRLIRQEYPVTPEEAFISSGNCIFDKEQIENRLLSLNEENNIRGIFEYDRKVSPVYECGQICDMSYSLENIHFAEKSDGYITLHEKPYTEYDSLGNILRVAPYVLGGDTSGAGDDYYTGKVIDNRNKRTVATLHVQRIDEDIYAEQMLCLAKYYNNALIAIETNYSREPLRVIEQKYGYTNLYRRERLDKSVDEIQTVTGFETTRRTKPIIIGELVSAMRCDPTLECDRPTLREMLTFIRKENGSTEAMKGCHDDLVMALAIAHFCSKQQLQSLNSPEMPQDSFISDNFKIGRPSVNYIKW